MSDFNEIYTKKWRQVYKNCYNLLENHSLAEEATQDTMYKLLINFEDIRQETLDAWLKRVATNVCINILKRQQYEKNIIKDFPMQEDVAGIQLMKEAREIAKTLAPKHREVFYLAFECGLHNKEIADRLNIPLSTVKSRIKVCLDELRSRLR